MVVDDQDATWPVFVDPVTSTAALTFTGPAITAAMGTAVGGGGDVNKDGYADIIIGAPGYSSSAGIAYVYYGSSTGPSTTADVTLTAPSGAGAFGTAVDIAGDVNKDGYDDVIVGAPNSTTTATNDGAAWIYYGSASGLSTTSPSKITGSLTASSYFGFSVNAAGDMNKDGYADVVIGEYGYSSEMGRAWIYAGSSSGISSTVYRTLVGTLAGQRFGWAVSGGGDISGDGYGDIVVGSPMPARGVA